MVDWWCLIHDIIVLHAQGEKFSPMTHYLLIPYIYDTLSMCVCVCVSLHIYVLVKHSYFCDFLEGQYIGWKYHCWVGTRDLTTEKEAKVMNETLKWSTNSNKWIYNMSYYLQGSATYLILGILVINNTRRHHHQGSINISSSLPRQVILGSLNLIHHI